MNKEKIKLFFYIILELFLIIFIFFISYFFIYKPKITKEKFTNSNIEFYERNKENNFKINRVISYSSSFGENKNKDFSEDSWILDIYQYTDFGLYIEQGTNSFIKNLWINDFKIISPPRFGTSNCYYMDALKFGTEHIMKDYEFTDKIEYTVLNDTNSENAINYTTPVFFADCSTPICIKYVNSLMKNFTLKNTNQITQDGKLLSNAINDVKMLDAKISFTIHVIDNNKNEYKCNITLEIPTENLLTAGSSYNVNNNFNTNFIKVN